MSEHPVETLEVSAEVGPTLRAVTRWVHRIGVQRATIVIVGLSVLASVLLDAAWHLLAGWPLTARSVIIATLVPIPISAVGAGVTFRLIAALDRALRRVEELALTDPLTGVRNRRCFMQVAALEFERATRHGRPMALVLIDVAHLSRPTAATATRWATSR